MINPDYQGGDGELLWNVYYGDLAKDERFNAFRADQLWDAEVIRPILEMDVKYERFQLNHEAMNVHRGHKSTFGRHQWAVIGAAAVVIVAVLVMYFRHQSSYKQIVAPSEGQALLYGTAQ